MGHGQAPGTGLGVAVGGLVGSAVRLGLGGAVGVLVVVGVLVGVAVTTWTTPCMLEWTTQWYRKSPAVVKVKSKVWPGLSGTEAQSPRSLPGPWKAVPLFVQRTVSP